MRAVSVPCNSTRPVAHAFTHCSQKTQGRRAIRATPLRGMGSAEYQTMGFRRGGRVARLNVGPVDDIPERLDVVGLDVLVLQVESVLPHVDLQQRNDAERDVGLLVIELEGQQSTAEAVVAEYRPARPLEAVGRGAELSLELVERTERVVNGGCEIAGGFVTTVRRQVLPPDRVVDVAAQVEGQVLLVQEDRGMVALGTGLVELGERIVEALDVGRVVLAVVDLVD